MSFSMQICGGEDLEVPEPGLRNSCVPCDFVDVVTPFRPWSHRHWTGSNRRLWNNPFHPETGEDGVGNPVAEWRWSGQHVEPGIEGGYCLVTYFHRRDQSTGGIDLQQWKRNAETGEDQGMLWQSSYLPNQVEDGGPATIKGIWSMVHKAIGPRFSFLSEFDNAGSNARFALFVCDLETGNIRQAGVLEEVDGNPGITPQDVGSLLTHFYATSDDEVIAHEARDQRVGRSGFDRRVINYDTGAGRWIAEQPQDCGKFAPWNDPDVRPGVSWAFLGGRYYYGQYEQPGAGGQGHIIASSPSPSVCGLSREDQYDPASFSEAEPRGTWTSKYCGNLYYGNGTWMTRFNPDTGENLATTLGGFSGSSGEFFFSGTWGYVIRDTFPDTLTDEEKQENCPQTECDFNELGGEEPACCQGNDWSFSALTNLQQAECVPSPPFTPATGGLIIVELDSAGCGNDPFADGDCITAVAVRRVNCGAPAPDDLCEPFRNTNEYCYWEVVNSSCRRWEIRYQELGAAGCDEYIVVSAFTEKGCRVCHFQFACNFDPGGCLF